MTSIKVVGAQRVANRYRTLVSQSERIVEPVIKTYAKDLQKELSRRRYPAKLPNQQYVRTGRLGSSFSARKVGKASWRVLNSAKYAQFVIDQNNQAGIHQGRWWTIQEVEAANRRDLTSGIVEAITEHVSD